MTSVSGPGSWRKDCLPPHLRRRRARSTDVDTAYVERYPLLYRRHWWWRARESLLLELLRELDLPGSPPTILDVGCGDGLFFDRLAELGDVWGVEPETRAVSADGPWASRIHHASFDAGFDPGRRFSLILMLDVLEHMQDAAAALRHAADLLLPGGVIVVTVPAFQSLWTSHDLLNHHFTRYDAGSFRALAARAGVQIHSMRYFFHWLFPLKLIARGVEKVTRRAPQSPGLPPRWLNQALIGFCRLEQNLTRRLPLPFGSSLLVIAEAVARPIEPREGAERV
jgi:SAM-dependent methyltransferase